MSLALCEAAMERHFGAKKRAVRSLVSIIIENLGEGGFIEWANLVFFFFFSEQNMKQVL